MLKVSDVEETRFAQSTLSCFQNCSYSQVAPVTSHIFLEIWRVNLIIETLVNIFDALARFALIRSLPNQELQVAHRRMHSINADVPRLIPRLEKTLSSTYVYFNPPDSRILCPVM